MFFYSVELLNLSLAAKLNALISDLLAIPLCCILPDCYKIHTILNTYHLGKMRKTLGKKENNNFKKLFVEMRIANQFFQ